MKAIRRVSGQAMVEFALVFPLLLLLTVVFIDLGRIVYFHSALYNAVREGSRYAIVTQFANSTQREAGIRQKVVDYSVALPIELNNVTVFCDRNPANLVVNQANPCATYVTVKAQVQIVPMTVFLSQILGMGNTFNITAESTMQMTPYGTYVP